MFLQNPKDEQVGKNKNLLSFGFVNESNSWTEMTKQINDTDDELSWITWGKSDELVACKSSVNARLCCSRTVLNSSLIAIGERRFMAAKRWPITEIAEAFENIHFETKSSK